MRREVAIALIFTSACASMPGTVKYKPKKRVYEESAAATKAPAELSPGSLWQDGRATLFSDMRAMRENDVVVGAHHRKCKRATLERHRHVALDLGLLSAVRIFASRRLGKRQHRRWVGFRRWHRPDVLGSSRRTIPKCVHRQRQHAAHRAAHRDGAGDGSQSSQQRQSLHRRSPRDPREQRRASLLHFPASFGRSTSINRTAS